MKGIILAGGKGTRLYPMTASISKQLLPVYDKPMIYYPLTTLMLAGIKEIIIVTTPEDQLLFKELLRDGEKWGINLLYAVQEEPRGIADVFNVVEDLVKKESVCLILGDNIFYSEGLISTLEDSKKLSKGSKIFGYTVKDPKRYGVLKRNREGEFIDLEEKPDNPSTNLAIPGLYFYDEKVFDIVKKIKPSQRGELEITDINREYLKNGELEIEVFGRGTAWFDTGTPESLLQASNFIATIETRQGLKIGCPEEIAYRKGFLNKEEFMSLVSSMPNNEYRNYLLGLLDL